jgi:uncharacterized protein YecT (DUF1311 family)
MISRSLVRAVVLAALIGLTAGCHFASSSAAASPGATSPSAQPTPGDAKTAPPFAAIIEPFDPGHPAQTRTGPADCGSQPSTPAIVSCYEIKTENTDAQIDTVQQGLYNSASLNNAKAAIVTQDSAWLAARGPVCQAAFTAVGSIDQISVAACLLDESTARLGAIKNITPSVARLKSTDSTNPNDLSWFTTPEGSRIAEIDTQGDRTGGAVVSWVIIGGFDGFVVNPQQFSYVDGSFVDPGIITGPNPTDHKVPAGVMYQFSIDYSLLSHDPNAKKGTGSYVYVPGIPVAAWQ